MSIRKNDKAETSNFIGYLSEDQVFVRKRNRKVLFHMLAKAKDVENSTNMLQYLKDFNVDAKEIRKYKNDTMRTLRDIEAVNEAVKFFEMSRDITPLSHSNYYNIIVCLSWSPERVGEVWNYFHEMMKNHIAPKAKTFDILLEVAYETKNRQGLDDCLKYMETYNIDPSISMLRNIALSYANLGDQENCDKYLDLLQVKTGDQSIKLSPEYTSYKENGNIKVLDDLLFGLEMQVDE
eukprot:TRINITY_DN2517_c0_g1_i4.p1 TRINITY_DN2517_c0_g1~~TRINITY_DN2517_c0_g1_i4.p1  ORF type:complete len:236 (+),score=61.69 TRINITY_DN2517_c0_g1_i4:367-1074(+)